MDIFLVATVVLALTSQCLGQQMAPAPVDPRFNQPNPNMPAPQDPRFNQPNPNMPAPQDPRFNQPNMNNNVQPPLLPNPNNPNFQPVPIPNQNLPTNIATNQLPGQQVPGGNAVVAQDGTRQAAPPQLTPEQQSQMTCAAAGRSAVSQCFQQNGGFQMTTVIALLSNGTQGQLPPNYEQVKQTLCQSHGQIAACVFDSISRYNGTQQCSTPSSFVRLEQETVGLLNGVLQLCGKGLMPTITPCMQRINYDMMQCFNKVGLNAELFSPRGSRMEGAIIGDNREVARMFCGKRKELAACQNKVLDTCEGAKTLQALSGNDQASVHEGYDVLCKDVDVYVSGLVCFQTPSSEVEGCANTLIRQMTEVTMKQIRDSLNADEFFTEYCKVRINNLKCDGNAWSKTCKPVAVGLKTEYQCSLLPSQCKNNPAIRALYLEACAEEGFARELRNNNNGNNNGGNSGSGHVLAGITSVFTTVLAFVLM